MDNVEVVVLCLRAAVLKDRDMGLTPTEEAM